MNGGVGYDSNIGELTCRNASTVDYLICTSNFIKCIDDLTIADFSKCFSDDHTPLSFTFESNAYENSDSPINALDNTEHIVNKNKWEDEKLHELRGNFNRQAIPDLCNILRGRKVSRIVIRYEQNGRKANLIVKRYEKYGRSTS